jgi:hypothetical protein
MRLHQIKKLLHIKENKYQSEDTGLQNGRKIFARYASDKGLISRIYKQLQNETPKEQIMQLINRQIN